MSSFRPVNGNLHFYMLCIGSYLDGDVFVEFFGPDKDAAVKEAIRRSKEFGYHLLSRPSDPGWAAGDEKGGYVEVRKHFLSQGSSFRDDNDRNDILFPLETTQFDNGKAAR